MEHKEKVEAEKTDKESRDSPWDSPYTAMFFALWCGWMLYDQETTGRRGGFTANEDPFLYWAVIVIVGGLSIYIFTRYLFKRFS